MRTLLRGVRTLCLSLAFAASLVQAVLWLHAMPLAVSQFLGLGGESFGYRLAAFLGYLAVAGLGGLLGWWCLVALDEPRRTVPRALAVAALLAALTLLAPATPEDPAAATALRGLGYWAARPRDFLVWLLGAWGPWLLLAQPLLLGLARLTLHAGPAVTPPEAR
jgi:hypothetical protein